MSDDPRRRIPGVDRLLDGPGGRELVERYPRGRVVEALRAAVDEARREMSDGAGDRDPTDPGPYLQSARRWLEQDARPSLRRVVNATGVVLHTNLGRAPLAAEAREALLEATAGYSNLEFDLEEGARGSRYIHCAALLSELTGAADALVVNNCAGALVLALNALAAGQGVVVSRGELVEIGGGFRIPDILARAGARLVEVGTTNRTRPDDYEAALDEGGVAAILKVHRSNFSVSGFTEEASLDALVALGRNRGVPVVHDVGSGLLLDPASLGLPSEPRPSESVAVGATLAVFSGDKLLGGPQAGCVVGEAPAVARLRANPLCRALRVDKGTLAALEATLRLYRDPDEARHRIPALAMLAVGGAALEARARRWVGAWSEAGLDCRAAPGEGRVGGGTYPDHGLASWTVRLAPPPTTGAAEIARALRDGDPPVVARVEDGEVVLDVRTVLEEEDTAVLDAVRRVAGGAPR